MGGIFTIICVDRIFAGATALQVYAEDREFPTASEKG
jgi:hypothetical protein